MLLDSCCDRGPVLALLALTVNTDPIQTMAAAALPFAHSRMLRARFTSLQSSMPCWRSLCLCRYRLFKLHRLPPCCLCKQGCRWRARRFGGPWVNFLGFSYAGHTLQPRTSRQDPGGHIPQMSMIARKRHYVGRSLSLPVVWGRAKTLNPRPQTPEAAALDIRKSLLASGVPMLLWFRITVLAEAPTGNQVRLHTSWFGLFAGALS